MSKKQDLFIAMASHELKTPLANIKILGQLLERHLRHLHDQEADRLLKKIDVKVNEMNDLINLFLTVSKIHAQTLEFSIEQFNFDELIKKTIADFGQFNPSHQITLKGAAKRSVLLDRQRLSEVLINLLKNAVKYSPGKNKVTVTVRPRSKYIEVSVKDYGVGIAKKYSKKIFEPYFTFNSVGLGVGLFISDQIIRALGGKIWVESQLGRGAKFIFRLPYQAKRKKVH